MNYSEITFKTICAAWRRQWKFLIVYILVVSFVGTVASYFYADGSEAVSPAKSDVIPNLILEDVEKDRNFFSMATNKLSGYAGSLELVLTAISEESTLTDEQKQVVSEFQEDLLEWKKEQLKPLQEQLSMGAYIHPQGVEDAIAYYMYRYTTIELNLIESSAAYELLRTMNAPLTENEEILSNYNKLQTQAALYGSYQKELIIIQNWLEELKNPTELIARSWDMVRNVAGVEQNLNLFAQNLGAFLANLAEDNQLILRIEFSDETSFNLSITHTYRDIDASENFAALSLFCVLTSVCSGLFFAICKEVKQQKKKGEF